MGSTLSQIVASLGSVYDPLARNIETRRSAIPGQIAEEEKGLQAQQGRAFGDILGGARQRGLGFSGIPLAEQAKYTATEFLPAMARLRQSGREQSMGLEDALLNLNRERRTQAQSIYDTSRQYKLARNQFLEGKRQFDLGYQLNLKQFEEQKRQAARAAAAASSYSPSLGATLGALGGGSGSGGGGNQLKNQIASSVQQMLGRRDSRSFYEELLAINKSASFGNTADRMKLELLRASQPGLFTKNSLNTNRVNALLSQMSGSRQGGW